MCAVAQLIFARNIPAVAQLFGELMLLPPEALASPAARAEFERALTSAASRVLVAPASLPGESASSEEGDGTLPPGGSIPKLNFDELLGALASIAPAFAFELPPYFLNNARALATLEGMARSVDPNFDVLEEVNSSQLPVVLVVTPHFCTIFPQSFVSLCFSCHAPFLTIALPFDLSLPPSLPPSIHPSIHPSTPPSLSTRCTRLHSSGSWQTRAARHCSAIRSAASRIATAGPRCASCARCSVTPPHSRVADR